MKIDHSTSKMGPFAIVQSDYGKGYIIVGASVRDVDGNVLQQGRFALAYRRTLEAAQAKLDACLAVDRQGEPVNTLDRWLMRKQ